MIVRYRQGKETFAFLYDSIEGIIVEGKTISFITNGSVFEVNTAEYTDADVSFDDFPSFFENFACIANVGCVDVRDAVVSYAENGADTFRME